MTDEDTYQEVYTAQHETRNESDLEKDFESSLEVARRRNPEDWTLNDVFENLTTLGWEIEPLWTVDVRY